MTVHSADQRGGQVPAPHTPQFAIAAAADDTMSEAELLDKLNTNVREMSDAEQAVAGLEWATKSARQKLTACSREVGLQLLELKRQTRTVKAFEAALERVDGLKVLAGLCPDGGGRGPHHRGRAADGHGAARDEAPRRQEGAAGFRYRSPCNGSSGGQRGGTLRRLQRGRPRERP